MSGPAQNCKYDIPGRFPLKATDTREISTLYLHIPAKSDYGIQVNNRAVLNPIFKKVGNYWVDAIGDIDVRYDIDFVNALLRNASDCNLDIIVRIL